MLKILLGNIFDSKAETLVNTVNCVGVMGKGIALEFKKRYTSMFDYYAELCRKKQIRPGVPYYYSDLMGNSILLFPTKDHWRSPSKLAYIEDGLDWFISHYQELGITSVAFPPLGCGNGGLDWIDVGALMVEKLQNLPISIEIYAPYGIKDILLQPDKLLRLSAKRNINERSIGIMSGTFNDAWLPILYITNEINSLTYVSLVGRTTFQKICYVVTREGFPTGFVFRRGRFGPYSKDVDQAERIMFNSNMICEQPMGDRMKAIVVSQDLLFNENSFSSDEMERISKIIDLFSRLYNTDQVEMMTTVMFAWDELQKTTDNLKDTEVLDSVCHWKPHWKDRQEDILDMIIFLTEFGWIRCELTPELVHDEFYEFV